MQNSVKTILLLLIASFSLTVSARSHKGNKKDDVSVKVEQVKVEEPVEVNNHADAPAVNSEKVDVVVFPNPAKSDFTISVSDNSFDFALYSKNGKQLISASDCKDSYKMDTTTLSVGVYILNVIVDDNIYMKRIVVM